jgi:hypothetical protein
MYKNLKSMSFTLLSNMNLMLYFICHNLLIKLTVKIKLQISSGLYILLKLVSVHVQRTLIYLQFTIRKNRVYFIAKSYV